jgi:hypothetical protein
MQYDPSFSMSTTAAPPELGYTLTPTSCRRSFVQRMKRFGPARCNILRPKDA